MWSPRLAIKLDQITMLRNSRRLAFPDPIIVSGLVQQCNVDYICCGMRPEQSLTQTRDLQLLHETLTIPLLLEIAPTQDNVKHAYEAKPQQAIIIPDIGNELTTTEGIDVLRAKEQTRGFIQSLKDADILANVFIEPDLDQTKNVHRIDAHGIVIHTRKFVEARTNSEKNSELEKIIDVAKTAHRLGLSVFASGQLNPDSLRMLSPIEEISTFIVGHWLVSRALFVGFPTAIEEITAALREGPKRG